MLTTLHLMKKPSPTRKLLGFTLLELLVVISIIGILVAIGAASFSVAQRQGRDARRRADMKAFQAAMEQCYAVVNDYDGGTGCTVPADNTVAASLQATVDGRITRVNDPANAANYIFRRNAIGYCACADLDVATGGNGAGCTAPVAPVTSNPPTITAGVTHFCVQQLQ